MEKFCQHIEKLLAQHDYVVIPRLGGFVVQGQSAVILHDRITAPFSTIAFNPLMHHADGLLAIEIARSKQISYRMAVEYINREVEVLHSKLNLGNTVRFGNLGFFSINEEGLLIFRPTPNADFLPGNYLLSNLYPTVRNNESVRKKTAVSISLTLPSVRTFRYAAAAMLVFGLFLSTPKVNDNKQSTASIASFVLKPNTAATVSVRHDVTGVKLPVVEKDTDKNVVGERPQTGENFHVIIASLPNKEAAEQFCREFPGGRYSGIRVLSTTKTHRVAIASFNSKLKAVQYMEELRKSDPLCESAWVLCDASK